MGPRRLRVLLAAVWSLHLGTAVIGGDADARVSQTGTPQRGAGSDRPNILLIMVDDLGKDWISCYGADGIETPNIDRLAKTGMKFKNAWSMPQCTPTRVALLTGQYPWRSGWVNHWDVPRWGVGYFDWTHYVTFARVAKSAGYHTAISGKWQINDFRLAPSALEHHGFDDWCVWTGYETGNPPSGERYWDPYVHQRDGSKTHKGKFGPDVYCDFLIDSMERHRDEPMLLYFAMTLTHGPLVTPPAPGHDGNSSADAPRGKPRKRGRQTFAGMVRYTDRLVGRLVTALEKLSLRKRTVVIFTTDNGTPKGLVGTIGGKKPRGGKGSQWEAGICQPFIVSCPGLVPSGVETEALTDFTDFLPTVAELTGGQLPDDTPLDGKSLAPLLTGKSKASRRDWTLAMGYGAARRDSAGVRGRDDFTQRVLRDERYKVWVNSERKIDALYDLIADPWEDNNLVEKASGSDKQSEAGAALRKFERIVGELPATDARPKYRLRPPNAWDRKR